MSQICSLPSNCTYTWNSGSCANWIGVNSGQTLCISSGTHTCNVNLNGGTIYVAPGASWRPANGLNINGGRIINCGDIQLLNSTLGGSPTIENYGTFSADAVNYNSTADIYNGPDASFSIRFNFTDLYGSNFVNEGVVNFNESFTLKGAFTNHNRVNVQFAFVTDAGSFISNYGWLQANNYIRFNSSSTINNRCTFIAENNIYIDYSITNNGLFFVANAAGEVTVNGATTFTNNGDVVTQRFLNNGQIYGSGDIWVYGQTQQNSSASTGSDGMGLNFYDDSPTGSQYYDIQAGVIDPSVSRLPPEDGVFPDRNEVLAGCSEIYRKTSLTPEICGDGFDNDGNGLIDCADPACGSCSNLCATGVQLLNYDHVSASGAGAGGVAVLNNLYVPEATNRVVFVAAMYEREHCQPGDNCSGSNTAGVGLGDNFSDPDYTSTNVFQMTGRFTGPGGTVDVQNPLVLPAGDLRFAAQYAYITPPEPNVGATFYSRSMLFFALYESDIRSILGGFGSGSISVRVADATVPLDEADDAMIAAFVLSSVEQSATGVVRSGVNTTVNAINGGAAALPGDYSISVADIDDGQEPDEEIDGMLVLAMNGIQGYGFETISEFEHIFDAAVINNSGDFGEKNESDGFTLTSQFRSGPSSGIIDNFSIRSTAPSNFGVNGGMVVAFTFESCEDLCQRAMTNPHIMYYGARHR